MENAVDAAPRGVNGPEAGRLSRRLGKLKNARHQNHGEETHEACVVAGLARLAYSAQIFQIEYSGKDVSVNSNAAAFICRRPHRPILESKLEGCGRDRGRCCPVKKAFVPCRC